MLCLVGCPNGKGCYSEKYKVDLCNSENRAFRPVLEERILSNEEFEFIAENEEFRRTGFKAIIVKSKKTSILQLALLREYEYVDFSNKENYRIYLYQVNYWRNTSCTDSFLIAEVIMIKK